MYIIRIWWYWIWKYDWWILYIFAEWDLKDRHIVKETVDDDEDEEISEEEIEDVEEEEEEETEEENFDEELDDEIDDDMENLAIIDEEEED